MLQTIGNIIYFILLNILLTHQLDVINVPKENKCWLKQVSEGNKVCVCNAEYCDTINSIEPISGKYIQYTSTKDGLRFEKTQGEFDEQIKSEVLITIEKNITYQTVHGYGGSFTDAAGINIKLLSDKAQENLMNSYFSSNGLEYNTGRVPIGGTDFSTRPYSYLDEKINDTLLTSFKLAEEDYKYKIPIISWASKLTKNQLELVASPWSPPIWMKTNNDWVGVSLLKTEYYQTWADYFLNFLKEYYKQGVQFWGITTGNEPLDGIVAFLRINSLGWNISGLQTWIKNNLGPTIRTSDFKHLKILTLDDQRILLPWVPKLLFNDKNVSNYVDGIACHWYLDDFLPISKLANTQKLFPEKFLLYTEASVGDRPWENSVEFGSWNRGKRYLSNIIETFNNNVIGWTDWNLALNMEGGPNWKKNYVDSPILVNSTADEFYKQPLYYAIGHVSKFVPRGSIRIEHKLNGSKIEVMTSLRNDGAIVVVILNKHNYDIPVSIKEEQILINTMSLKNSFTSIVFKH